MANKVYDLSAKTYAARTDCIFTTPAVIMQLISGIILINVKGWFYLRWPAFISLVVIFFNGI
ncbi:MAG: hypothetical protein AB8U25_06255 [Rickettsiales endosymbiont of Dermacentor nuttalli]